MKSKSISKSIPLPLAFVCGCIVTATAMSGCSQAADRTLAFSGDTEWVDALVPCAADADLFLVECCAVDRPMKFHLNWRTIGQRLPQLSAKRIMLTHMNADMLGFAPSLKSDRILVAEDGLQHQL